MFSFYIFFAECTNFVHSAERIFQFLTQVVAHSNIHRYFNVKTFAITNLLLMLQLYIKLSVGRSGC